MVWNEKTKKLAALALWGAVGLLALKYLLPILLPFLLGLGAALALTPLIRRLQEKFSLGRGLVSAICVSALLLALGGILLLLGRFLLRELGDLYSLLPELMARVSDYLTAFACWAEDLAGELPGVAGDALRNWAENLTGFGGTLASTLYEKLFSFVSGFLGRLPDNLLFLLTLILSCYFSAAELPRLQALCREHLPQKRWRQAQELLRSLKTVLGGWLRAQMTLMGITFLILLVGFWVLGVDMPFVFALGVALLDALPLFGTGTILLPWGLFSLIAGDLHLGLGLMVLYGAAALSRNVLEPKLLGAQVGVSPLLTLLAIYVGYKLSGFLGMILLPIGVMVAGEVLQAGRMPKGVEARTQPGFQHAGEKAQRAKGR